MAIKIELTQLEHIYSILERPPKANACLEGDEWKLNAEGKESDVHGRRAGIRYTSIDLPYPLGHGNSFFKISGTQYSVTVVLCSEENTPFPKYENTLRAGLGKRWWQLNNNQVGYVFDKGGDPKFNVAMANDDRSRAVILGSGGARTRDFGSFEQFRTEVRELENVVNLILKASYTLDGKMISTPQNVNNKVPGHPELSKDLILQFAL
ncbi:MAG: hypothetical protein WCP89_04565 [archaeon]